MEMTTPIHPDRTSAIVSDNLKRIRLLAIAGTLLKSPSQRDRVLGLLENRQRWGLTPPFLMLAVHDDEEAEAATRFAADYGNMADEICIVRQNGHNETVGNAIQLFRQHMGANDVFAIKRQCLFLTRRGGKGKPVFISPFLGGAGTTCGEWTRPMLRNKDGTVVKGFMKASVAIGLCTVECPYCYLGMPYTDGMDVALNWEDLRDELAAKWRGYAYPINFGETSGLVEYDEWFAKTSGSGSIIQYVIDACADARVVPFFLTKIRYPRYLQFRGKVQVGISLMPEPIREWLAPNGSPADELLESLAWAWRSGAVDPVIRLTVIWNQREIYQEFLDRIVNTLGTTGWRLTLDILRFTPSTASIIAKRYPEAASAFAEEISPGSGDSLAALARSARSAKEHVKKIRPPAERQAEIFIWFRKQLNARGCREVLLTPCKGDPDELTPLARLKIISAMPCACYAASGRSAR